MIVQKKSLMLMFLTLLFITQSFFVVNAAERIVTIEPFYENISIIRTDIEIIDSKGNLSCLVKGVTGTSSITGEAKLERRNVNGTYTAVATWDNLSSNSSTLSFNKTYYVTKGYTYRLTFTATVIKDGIEETVSITASDYAD